MDSQIKKETQGQQLKFKPSENRFFIHLVVFGIIFASILYIKDHNTMFSPIDQQIDQTQDENAFSPADQPVNQLENDKNFYQIKQYQAYQQQVEEQQNIHPRLLHKNDNYLFQEGIDYNNTKQFGLQAYSISNEIKAQQHPSFNKYTKRIERNIDPIWKGKEDIAKQIAEYFQKFNTKIHQGIRYLKKKDQTPHLSIINEPDYCIKSDQYHILHPESIFENQLILVAYQRDYFQREAALDFGVNVHPNIMKPLNQTERKTPTTKIPLETTYIYSQNSNFHNHHPINKNSICTYQMYNSIIGRVQISGKDSVINKQREYMKKQFKNKEQCFETIEYMPASYRLFNEDECEEFFNYIQSVEYENLVQKEGLVFIAKEGSFIQKGKGIKLFSPEERESFLKMYDGGKKCKGIAQNKEIPVYQIQKYITNPMLIQNRKLEIRIYFLIASTDPLIIWVNNHPLLKKCALPYDKYDTSKFIHICNISQSQLITDDYIIDFSLEGLQDILLDEGAIKNPNWKDEVILPQIYGKITHLIRAGQKEMFKDSRTHEIFAVDIIIDQDSKIWILENNPGPQITKHSIKTVIRHHRMYGDIFDIQYAYLRSKAKRLNKLAEEMKTAIENNQFDEQKYKQQFDIANQNKMEIEFEPKNIQSFVKVFDGNLPGKDKFMGYLPEGCLYQDEQ